MKGIFKASWRVALALALVLSLGLVTAAPAAADVTAATVIVSDNTANATATYTIAFTLSPTKDLAAGVDSIIIDFPAGTDASGVTTVTVDGAAANATIPVGKVKLVITVNATCSAGTVVKVDNVINPCPATTYTLAVSTTQETTPVASNPYTIAPGAPTYILVSPTATVQAGDTVTYTATAYDACNNTVAPVTATTAFGENGTAGSWVANVLTATVAGTNYVINGTNALLGLWATASLNITPGAAAKLMMGSQPANPTGAGTAIGPLTVNATDAFGNVLIGAPITASLLSGTGTLSGTLTQKTDATGNATFGDLKIDLMGEKKLQFTGSAAVNSSAFNITPAAPSKLVLIPSASTITAGGSQTYLANSTDTFGNVVVGNCTANVTFSIEIGAKGGVSVNTVTANASGTWIVTGTGINAQAGLTAGTATLTVNAGTPVDPVTVLPSIYYVTTGDAVTYTAMALDAHSNPVDVTASTTFTIALGAGGSWAANVYTSEDVGTYNITGTCAGLTPATATLVVRPDGHCFIATAAYGTPMAEEIQILRDFRDGYMLTNPVGRALVEFYYTVSPPVAQFITEHPSLQPIVRAMLVPALAMSTMVVNHPAATQMTMLVLLLVSIALAAWATRRQVRGPVHA